jgi:hypothetical protein
LAGAERATLDSYLAVMEDFEARQKNLQMITCNGIGASPKEDGDPAKVGALGTEDKLESMNDIGTLALACGLTNVTGMAGTVGHGHGDVAPMGRRLSAEAGFPVGYYGHGPSADGNRARPMNHCPNDVGTRSEYRDPDDCLAACRSLVAVKGIAALRCHAYRTQDNDFHCPQGVLGTRCP